MKSNFNFDIRLKILAQLLKNQKKSILKYLFFIIKGKIILITSKIIYYEKITFKH